MKYKNGIIPFVMLYNIGIRKACTNSFSSTKRVHIFHSARRFLRLQLAHCQCLDASTFPNIFLSPFDKLLCLRSKDVAIFCAVVAAVDKWLL
jgi:hypothetical protein